MNRFIPGKDIYLRGIQTSDANPTYLSWLNDPEITSGLVIGRFPSDMASLQSYIAGSINRNNAVMFAICDSKTDLHIGNIKLDGIEWTAGTCELGLMIGDRNYWGKGVGTEACNLAASYAFNNLNLRKIVLTVFTNNPAAIKLYEKIGYREEGRLKEQIFRDGNYFDKIYMALFKTDFKK